MNMREYLRQAAQSKQKRALPILSFPATQKMNVTVRELVTSGELQAQAMELIATETPTLAAVSLMDLSVEAEAFGAQTRFADNEVPAIIGQLIADGDDADKLQVPEVGAGRTGACIKGIRLAKRRITDKPVLAGCIGPYSLSGRLCDVTQIMYLCYDEPEAAHTVLRKATEFLTEYCLALREAGASGVVLAEPLAGLLSPEMCAEFSSPYVDSMIKAVQTDDFAVVYHNCGSTVPKMLPQLYALGAAAYHFGNAIDLRAVLDQTPKDTIVMGNIDPVSQFANGTVESMTQATRALLASCGQEPNFILSSGCDIPPRAKWENISAFFAAAEGYRA